jgi:hypothetical protein
MMGGTKTQWATQSAFGSSENRSSQRPAFVGGTKAGKRPPKNIHACHLPVIQAVASYENHTIFSLPSSPKRPQFVNASKLGGVIFESLIRAFARFAVQFFGRKSLPTFPHPPQRPIFRTRL